MLVATLASRLKTGIERHAAVDEDARAVDVVRLIGREPSGNAADVVHFADAFVRRREPNSCFRRWRCAV